MKYDEHEAKVVASLITYYKEKSFGQLFGLKKGLKEFNGEGICAAKKEISQMHSRVGFKAIAVAE